MSCSTFSTSGEASKNHLPLIRFDFGHVYHVYAIIKHRFIIKWLEKFMNIHSEHLLYGSVCAWWLLFFSDSFYGLSIKTVSFLFNVNVQMTMYRPSKSIKFPVLFFMLSGDFVLILILISYLFRRNLFQLFQAILAPCQMNIPQFNGRGG